MIRRGFLLLFTLSIMMLLEASEMKEGALRAFRTEEMGKDYIEMTFSLPDYSIDTISKDGKEFKKLNFENASYFLDEGKPELPYFSSLIATPQGSLIKSIEVLSFDTKKYEDFRIYPAQDYSKPDEHVFHFDSEYYQSDKIYPYSETSIGNSGVLRDFYLCNYSIAPCFYNPSDNSLEVRDNIRVRIHLTNIENSYNECNKYSIAFKDIYECYIDNFDAIRNNFEETKFKRILIIYRQNNDTIFHAKLSEFINWKIQRGYIVDTFDTSETGTSTSGIKNFIQSRYDDTVNRPDYLIIVGDVSGTFGIPTFIEDLSNYSGSGDHPYTHLAGNDTLGDMFIGRMSIENTNHFLTLVNKVFYYERDMPLNITDWYDKMLLVGDTDPSGQSCVYVNKYIKAIAHRINPDYSFTELYSDSPSISLMNQSLSQGVGIFNYRGFIGMSNWTPSASNLNNGDRLCHSTILTCSTGTFESNSTTEEFIRLGSPTLPKGALTAIGMSTPGTHTLFNNALATGIWNGILNYDMRDLGQGLLAGELNLYNQYNSRYQDAVEYFNHWCNLMGDPTVTMYLGVPKQFYVDIATTIPMGTRIVPVEVLDEDWNPSIGAIVTAFQPQGIHEMVRTNEYGMAYIELPEGVQGNITVTVTKDDYKSNINTITVDGTGGIVYSDYVLIDTEGNNDGNANAGETVELNVSLTNNSNSDIDSINATLLALSDYVTVNQSTVSYGLISPSNNSTGNGLFSVSIAPNCPDTFKAIMRLHIETSTGSSYSFFELPIHNGNLEISDIDINDYANGILDQGETSELYISLINNGTTDLTNISLELVSLNASVVVEDSLVELGNISVNDTEVNTSDPFIIRTRTNVLPGMTIPMNIICSNQDGYEEMIRFNLEIGQISDEDPFGPDDYGYFIYHSSDDSYHDCPEYNWIEIAPDEGGQGTELNLYDPGSWSEGDVVEANAITQTTLPFEFSFYGQTYDTIWICSNGFVSFLETECADWRNNEIFGAMTQNALIAPFWDDLDLDSNASVSTYYNNEEQYFVIEWNEMSHGVTGATETFEIVLYSQDYYPTSIGDGMIKIQYKTFNNNDYGSEHTGGNFSTIGIRDHTGKMGLQYSFNNEYLTGANEINSGDALLVTGSPIFLEESFLVLGYPVIHDSNDNHVIEPGESVNLGINLVNIGAGVAEGVTISVSSESPYVSISNHQSTYDSIPGEGSMFGNEFISLNIADNTPDNHEIALNVDIETLNNGWVRVQTLNVVSNKLIYKNASINDQVNGNGDKIVQAGEDIFLCVNLENPEVVKTTGIQVGLNCSYPGVEIPNNLQLIGDADANSTIQTYFEISIPEGIADLTYISFEITYSANGVNQSTANLTIGIGLADFDFNFENSNGGLISQGGWQWGYDTLMGSHSGLRVWGTYLSGNYPDNNETTLTTPVIPLSDNAQLRFWHKYQYDNHYDGGNVKVSTDMGNSWVLIYPETGYDDAVIFALNDQSGFTGSNGVWTEVVFDLSSYANTCVQIRWTSASDYYVNDYGWYIDDLVIEGYTGGSGYITGNVILDGEEDVTKVNISNGEVVTHPDNSGSYYLFQKEGGYNIHAFTPHYSEGYVNRLLLSTVNPSYSDIDFSLLRLNEPNNLNCVQNRTDLLLSWQAPEYEGLTLNSYNIYRSIDSEPFALIGNTTDTAYTDILSYAGQYNYYVAASYEEGESFDSDLFSIVPDMTDVESNTVIATCTQLVGNYPNPFNPTTSLMFSLKENERVTIKVYNIKGQLVNTICDDVMEAGNHRIVWNGNDERGKMVSTGVYLFRMKTDNYTGTLKSIMIK